MEDDKYPLHCALLDPSSMRSNNLVRNLTLVLHTIVKEQPRRNRILIVLERLKPMGDLSVSRVNIARLSSVTNVKISCVHNLLSGKGRMFAEIKQSFDSSDDQSMAMLCYGTMDTFLVGTDLASTNAIVIVGSFHAKILTQALGRAMRPNLLRNNSVPIKKYCIYTE